MKRKITKSLSILVILCSMICSGIYAQSTVDQSTVSNQTYDQRLLNHYTAEELDMMKTDNPEKFNTIVYYYTQSYTLQIVDCFECTPVDPAQFDISAYENLRKTDEIRLFENTKLGFILTLVPINKLEYKLPIHLAKLESH